MTLKKSLSRGRATPKNDVRRMDLKELQAGDILLVHGDSLVSSIIMLADGTEVSHAALYHDPRSRLVAEATGAGVNTTSLAKCLGHAKYVLVYRLDAAVKKQLSMKPVLDVSGGYLSSGVKYGFGQVILAGLLGLTRRATSPTPEFSALMRLVLDRATHELRKVARSAAGAHHARMICSEFVYRCHDEAARPSPHPYEIKIAGVLPAGTRVRAVGSTRAESRIDEESLFARWLASSPPAMRARSLAERPAPRRKPPKDEDIEKAFHKYQASITGKASGSVRARGVGRTDDGELFASIDEFLAAYLEVRGGGPGKTPSAPPTTPTNPFGKRILSISPLDVPAAPATDDASLVAAVSDFVTPSDLYKSPSLKLVGYITSKVTHG